MLARPFAGASEESRAKKEENSAAKRALAVASRIRAVESSTRNPRMSRAHVYLAAIKVKRIQRATMS